MRQLTEATRKKHLSDWENRLYYWRKEMTCAMDYPFIAVVTRRSSQYVWGLWLDFEKNIRGQRGASLSFDDARVAASLALLAAVRKSAKLGFRMMPQQRGRRGVW